MLSSLKPSTGRRFVYRINGSDGPNLAQPPASSSARKNEGKTGPEKYWKYMGKQKLPETITIDSDTTEACGNQASKQCLDPVASHACRKDLIPEEIESVKTCQHVPPYMLDASPFPRRKRSRRRYNYNYAVSSLKKKLDSRAFECYLQKLWKNFPEEKKINFTYLDCLWFNLYLKAKHKPKVLTWIKNKQIFSKKYVFVPIVCWNHWSLLIFCHFEESFESETRKPCMLLLDSLQKADPRRLEPDIRKFVLDIFKEEGRSEISNSVYRIPLMVPKVPQQRNGEECGNFVLYFIQLFMESAPENFSIKEYPYFMKMNWFTSEGLDQFCKKLDHSEE